MAVAWDGGVAWDSGVLWATGQGETLDLQAINLIAKSVFTVGPVQGISNLQGVQSTLGRWRVSAGDVSGVTLGVSIGPIGRWKISGGSSEGVQALAQADLVGRWRVSAGAAQESLPQAPWPLKGVTLIVPSGGVDPDPVPVLEQYSFDLEVYEVNFDKVYLRELEDDAKVLESVSFPDNVPHTLKQLVGDDLPDGRVMFSVGPDVPPGVHEVIVKVSTTGGRVKGYVFVIKVDR